MWYKHMHVFLSHQPAYPFEASICIPAVNPNSSNVWHSVESCIVSWAALNMHQMHLEMLNVNGYFDGLFSFLDHAVEQGFINPINRSLFISALTIDQLIDQLEALLPGQIEISDDDSTSTGRKRKREDELNLNL